MYPPSLKPLPRHILHGADYNPEQWPPEIWEEDLRLMKLAGVNAVSLGMFSWSALEPSEGVYTFDWLDRVMDMLHAQDIGVLLATPSAGFPPWLARACPEVLKVEENGLRSSYRARQNHCFTSPVYRQKVRLINEQLAARYAHHPAVLLWHISNEYGSRCYCDLCREAFRAWLRDRYGSIDRLNAQWWTTFWSHRYSDWSEIDPPAKPLGETSVHGLSIAWKNFITHQTIDFMQAEIAAVRAANPALPVGTNMFRHFSSIDYYRLAREVDVILWDNYPFWHRDPRSDAEEAALTAFTHDMMRSMRDGQPFLMIESVPSAPNWQPVNKLKRPGMALLSAVQAVAHGSDAVMYFQWRKSRGAYEKFHGAVVDHCGHEDTRVFRDVAATGAALSRLDEVVGSTVPASAAVVFDWNNHWAIQEISGLCNESRDYLGEVSLWYRALWDRSISTDVIDQTGDFSRYRLLVAPFLYSLRPGVAARLETFVRSGGTLVLTHGAGTVDEDDLIFPGGPPGPLRRLLGLWVEETDALYQEEKVDIVPDADVLPGLQPRYHAIRLCERLRLESARPFGHYASEFYAGEPFAAVHSVGDGRVFYFGCETGQDFVFDVIAALASSLSLPSCWPVPLPPGVHAHVRRSPAATFTFLMNFTPSPVRLDHPARRAVDLASLSTPGQPIDLPPFGLCVLRDS